MISAFGVDHGEYSEYEIEKAGLGSITRLGTALGGATRRLGGKIAVGGAKTIKTNPSLGGAGHLGVKAGGGLRRLGAGMAARPGLTGGLALGGGAAGAGAAGGAFANRRRQY